MWGFATVRRLMAGIALIGACAAQAQNGPAPLPVAEDGTVQVPAMSVPVSDFLSPEARAYVAEHLLAVASSTRELRPARFPPLIAPYIPRMKARYHTHREETVIAGVKAYVYTPAEGIAAKNRKRVLINLHGGGFRECFPGCAELESIPIAALMRIKVVSLDYRQGPENRFPAASEDVAAVYRLLLKTYRPDDIGIYGCSAGGMLTGMSLAWFQTHGLPRPGAAGIFCAGGTLASAGFGGDAIHTALPLGEARMPSPPSPSGAKASAPPLGYLAGVDPLNPLAAPASSPWVMAKFPPTLIITGTRGFEYSSAIYTHGALVKAGVDAELRVWEGLFHGFYYNPDVPESRDAYNVMVRFFDRHLGKSGRS